MAKSYKPIFPARPATWAIDLENADSTNLVTIHDGTSDYDGFRIDSLVASSDDTGARVVQLWVSYGSSDYLLGSVSVPAGAGTDGSTPAVDLLDPQLFPGLKSIGALVSGNHSGASTNVVYSLKAGVTVAVTAGKTLTIVGFGGHYSAS